jgi:hypothetical protein
VGNVVKLLLGVIDQPYGWSGPQHKPPKPKKGKKAPLKKTPKPVRTTTGDVMEYLETKYKVIEVFYKVKEAAIQKLIFDSIEGAIETALMTDAPLSDGFLIQALNQATFDIDKMFRDWLTERGPEKAGIPGTPTRAAQMGVKSHLKSGYTKGRVPRPSFIDTGLYRQNFHSWVQ